MTWPLPLLIILWIIAIVVVLWVLLVVGAFIVTVVRLIRDPSLWQEATRPRRPKRPRR